MTPMTAHDWRVLLNDVTQEASALDGLTTLLLHGSSALGASSSNRYQDVDLLFVFSDETLGAGIQALDEIFARLEARGTLNERQIYRRHSGPMHPVRDQSSGDLIDLTETRVVFWHVSIFPASAFSSDVAVADAARPSKLLLYTWQGARVLLGHSLPPVDELTTDDILNQGLGIRDSLTMLQSRSRGYWDWSVDSGVPELSWRVVSWEDFEAVEFPLYAVRWALRHLATLMRRRLPYKDEGVEALITARNRAHTQRIDRFARAERLRDEWRQAYTAEPALLDEMVDTDGLVADGIALLESIGAVIECLKTWDDEYGDARTWSLPLGQERSGPTVMTSELSAALLRIANDHGPDQIVVLADESITRMLDLSSIVEAGNGGQPSIAVWPQRAGAQGKTLDDLLQVLRRAEQAGLTRSSMLVLVGGGNLGNMGGMAAGLVCRGLRYVHVPTTVTAALDSAIGQKQAVNGSLAKNYFGMLHPPTAVLIDPALLLSLPRREVLSGLVEALKHGLCQDAALVSAVHSVVLGSRPLSVLADIVGRTIELKLEYLQQDVTEMADGQFLELGHKVGHAVEHLEAGAAGHGECVAFGMIAEAKLMELRGSSSPDVTALIEEAVGPVAAELSVPGGSAREIAEQVCRDNRRQGYDVTFAYIGGPQRPRTATWDVREIQSDLEAAVAWAQMRLRNGAHA